MVAGALVAPATPAFAHGGDTPGATAYRTAVTGLTPPMTGLTVRAVEAGTRLELSNETGREIEILGDSGEPYLAVRPDGTYQNVNSPADPAAPPSWRRVSASTTVRWHDERTQWQGSGLPPAAAADPSRAHRLRDWSVPLRDQVRTFEVRGTLDWLPPPPAWLWWAGALLAFAAFTMAARWAGLVALFAGTTTILYAVLTTLDGGSLPLAPVVSAAAAIAAGVLTLRRRAPFLLALAGALLAIFAGIAEAAVFSEAVVPIAGPFWLARAAVLVALAAGLAMCTTGALRIRASPPRPA
jgi:hypothetical protein